MDFFVIRRSDSTQLCGACVRLTNRDFVQCLMNANWRTVPFCQRSGVWCEWSKWPKGACGFCFWRKVRPRARAEILPQHQKAQKADRGPGCTIDQTLLPNRNFFPSKNLKMLQFLRIGLFSSYGNTVFLENWNIFFTSWFKSSKNVTFQWNSGQHILNDTLLSFGIEFPSPN